MWALFAIGFGASTSMSWRLVTVVTKSDDVLKRADAIRMCGYIWGGGTVGTGLVTGMVKLHELGVLQ